MVLRKHSRVSFYRCFHLLVPRKLNTQVHLFSDLSVTFLDQILRFLYCSMGNPFFGHCGPVQGQAHVGLFLLYTTSLPCHCSRHVRYLQEISCYFKQWDVAITSTIYTSVASSKVIRACFVHSRRCLSGNSSMKIAELTTTWGSIPWTVRTNALINHGGLMLQAVKNWSCSSWRKPTVWYTVNWWPLTKVWIYSHPTACCF